MGLTRRPSVMSPITLLFLMFVVNLLRLWSFQKTELLMLMEDTAENHPHLFQVLLQLPQLPIPTRLEFLTPPTRPTPPPPPPNRLNGSLIFSFNLIHLLIRSITPLPSLPSRVLLLLRLLRVSPRLSSVLPLLLLQLSVRLLLSSRLPQLPPVVRRLSPSLVLLMLEVMSTVPSLRLLLPELEECSTLLTPLTKLLLLPQLLLLQRKLSTFNLPPLPLSSTSRELRPLPRLSLSP